MNITKVVSVICFGVLLSCHHTKEAEESGALIAVLTDYFNAIEKSDRNKMNENTTPDYILFESGSVWNNDSLYNELQNFKDTRIEFTLDHFKVITSTTIGHASYLNHGKIYKNDSLINIIDWTENAVFKKVNDKWKLYFLQSTVKAKD